MKKVNIQFVNFWKGFKAQSYAFLELFQKRYHQNIVVSNPDIVFFADRIKRKPIHFDARKFGRSVKVFYTGENTKPDTNVFDFSFSFEDTSESNFQLTNFARQKNYFDFIAQTEPNTFQDHPKKSFCNFIYRNKGPQERIRFCKRLAQYKHIDCPGEVLNNMPNFTKEGRRSNSWLNEKIRNIKKYKFTIAFENQSARNYVTEKMFDPFYVGSIPIYWGAPNITEFFDTKSFVNVRDFKNYDEVVEYVKEIDNNDELYQQMRDTPPIHETSRLKGCTEESVLERFDKILHEVDRRKKA